MKKTPKPTLKYKVHTPNLIKEILCNPGTQALLVPLKILRVLLVELGERAAEINDPKLNALMCRLTIYAIADPEQPDYNWEIVQEILAAQGWA